MKEHTRVDIYGLDKEGYSNFVVKCIKRKISISEVLRTFINNFDVDDVDETVKLKQIKVIQEDLQDDLQEDNFGEVDDEVDVSVPTQVEKKKVESSDDIKEYILQHESEVREKEIDIEFTKNDKEILMPGSIEEYNLGSNIIGYSILTDKSFKKVFDGRTFLNPTELYEEIKDRFILLKTDKKFKRVSEFVSDRLLKKDINGNLYTFDDTLKRLYEDIQINFNNNYKKSNVEKIIYVKNTTEELE